MANALNRSALKITLAVLESLENRRLLAATTYAVVDLGAIGNGTSRALGINDLGEVVGTSTDSGGTEHAFLWKRGNLIDLGVINHVNPAEAVDINTRSDVAGTILTSTTQQAALFQTNGTTVLPLGTPAGARSSSAGGVNNASQVAGTAQLSNGVQHAVSFTPGGGSRGSTLVTDLGTLGGRSSFGNDINDMGNIVGGSDLGSGTEHAFIYASTQFSQQPVPFTRARFLLQDIGTLGGLSEATAINDGNQVVGFSATNNGQQHAFLWQTGTMQDLGALMGGTSTALGINSLGQVVGSASMIGPVPTHGFIWQNGVLSDLNIRGSLGGAVITEATDINSLGDIAATAVSGSITHAVLLVPVGRGGGDFIPPTGTISSRLSTINAPTSRPYTFKVTYEDNEAVDVTSLDNRDLVVTGPGRSRFRVAAQFLSVTPAGNGTPRMATYTLAAPRGGWTTGFNSTYSITLQPNQVFDTNGNAAAATVLGTFNVTIGSSAPAPRGFSGHISFGDSFFVSTATGLQSAQRNSDIFGTQEITFEPLA